MPPVGFCPYIPDSFIGKYSDGVTWGFCHNKHLKRGNFTKAYGILMRVDCDLTVSEIKKQNYLKLRRNNSDKV